MKADHIEKFSNRIVEGFGCVMFLGLAFLLRFPGCMFLFRSTSVTWYGLSHDWPDFPGSCPLALFFLNSQPPTLYSNLDIHL